MRTNTTIALPFLVAWFFVATLASAQPHADKERAELAKAEPITKADDLKDAKAQREAMAKAKRSLEAAASAAVKENKGFRAVSVMPAMKADHPVADVTLLKGTEWKTVTEKLD